MGMYDYEQPKYPLLNLRFASATGLTTCKPSNHAGFKHILSINNLLPHLPFYVSRHILITLLHDK